MTRKKRALIKRWVDIWKKTGSELERIRLQEVKRADTARAIEHLSDAFEFARLHYSAPVSSSSGLVEQQELFLKARQ